jgi:hypothetical protein
VIGFRIRAAGTVHCPAPSYAAWHGECQALGDSNSPTAGSVTLECPAATYVSDFNCFAPEQPGPHGRPVPGEIPAGTTITGRFKMEHDAIDPGDVKVVGLQSGDVESSPDTLSGP